MVNKLNEMSDQYLNNWLAINLMGWKIVRGPAFEPFYVKELYEGAEEFVIYQSSWDPCNTIHTAFKIQDTFKEGPYGDTVFAEALVKVLGFRFEDLADNYPDLVYATPRQRCEAAYLCYTEKMKS